MDREFGQRLQIQAATAAAQLGPGDLADAQLLGEEGTGYLAIQLLLEQLRSTPGIVHAVLLDSARAVIYDTRGPEQAQAPSALDTLAREALDRAYGGSAGVSAVYRESGRPRRAGIAPVLDRGRVVGVLAVEARPPYDDDLARLRRSLLLSTAVVGAALLILAAVVHRLAWSAVLLERRLSRSESLAAMGRLTATLAHEIKNPLAIIRGSAQRLGKLAPEAQRMADNVVEETDRLSRTVGRYLRFARPEPAPTGDGDARSALEATLGLLEGEFRERGIQVERDVRLERAPVALDDESLRQVFLNLLLNAQEAMPEGGRVRIEMAESRGRVEIAIADSGSGIVAGRLAELGQPFVTTKAQGSGLGLFLSRRLVQGAGGELSLESEAGRGTRCTIRLPRAAEAARGGMS